MKKILMVFGTRPEAIKMAPLYLKFLNNKDEFITLLAVTAQHRGMLDQVLKLFKIVPDYDLDIMKPNQSLITITISILEKLSKIVEDLKPDLILVHGDTSTAFVTSLISYYYKIKVAHIEAGLRTNNIYSPFPEEINRKFISLVSEFNFAPTKHSKNNLLKENSDKNKIYVVGNTVIDALKYTISDTYTSELLDWVGNDKLILLTAHRRENIGLQMEQIFTGVLNIIEIYKKVKVIFPVHSNPKVQNLAFKFFGSNPNVKLVEPLSVFDFHNLLNKCNFIISDSGGIQEEASALRKPMLVTRDTTERPEGLKTGSLRLVGTNPIKISKYALKLLNDRRFYSKMVNSKNPFGNGNSSDKIYSIIKKNLV